MMLFFLIILSFHSFVLSKTTSFNRQNSTCLLPFVTKPCINDGENLSCTFSLNSSERNRNCSFRLMSLIFTTSHVELFIIPQYYFQIIYTYQVRITKLIIEPNRIDRNFEYLHWSDIRILSIEIPVEISQFAFIHQKNSLDISRIQNDLNKQYWHLQIWPGAWDVCERTILTMNNFTTTKYDCPYTADGSQESTCSISYACYNNRACHAIGYRRLICFVNMIRPWMEFQALATIPQYETIIICLYQSSLSGFHEVNREAFIGYDNSNETTFLTKHLLVIVNIGILHVSPELFDSSNDFQIRIEHGRCGVEDFFVDILNDTVPSITDNLIELNTGRTGAIGCSLNISDSSITSRFKPALMLDNATLAYAGTNCLIVAVTRSLLPIDILWYRNKAPLTLKMSPFMTDTVKVKDMSYVVMNISRVTRNDTGMEFKIVVKNRFAEISATTHLNVSYRPTFIVPLQNQTVKQGSNVIIEALIDGNPVPDVYIQRYIFEERLYPVNNNQTLYRYNIPNVQLNHSGLYNFSAVWNHHEESIFETIFLTVLEPLHAMNILDNIVIEEDEHLNLTVLFSHSIIKTQWFVNDIPIENTSIIYTDTINNDQVVLIINTTSTKHNGQYKVQVWDILNQTNQSLTTIHIYSLPPLLIFCTNGTIANELYLYIACRFQGKDAHIQWINPNGQTLVEYSNYEAFNESAHIYDAKLVFTKIPDQMFGIYTFQVNNTGGSIIQKINFTLKDMLPTIGNHSFNVKKIYLPRNSSYSFNIHFNGIPWPNVTFFFNHKTLLSFSNAPASPVFLSLKNLSSENEGIYYARVMNSEGFIETNRTELCLLQAPSFILENPSLSTISVRPNQTITLITPKIKSGSPIPLKVVWYVSGRAVKLLFNSSMLQSELTINTSLKQQEQIACVIENQFGGSAYFFKLNFVQAPYFLLPLQKQIEIELHQTIVLTVHITGNPLPAIQWFHNQQIVDRHRFEQHTTIYSGVYSLIIRDVTLMDVGKYRIVAKNSEDQISSETQIIFKSTSVDPTETTIAVTTVMSTIKPKPTCGDNLASIIIIILLLGLIVIFFIPVLCGQNRLSALLNCRKDKLDDSDLLKSHDENLKNISPPQSNISTAE